MPPPDQMDKRLMISIMNGAKYPDQFSMAEAVEHEKRN